MLVAALAGAFIAVIVTVIALNVLGGEKRIQHRLEHRYGIDDPQFLHELGILLGPPMYRPERRTG